jgi:hypothetical protein
MKDRVEMAAFLLEHGANVQAKTKCARAFSCQHETS